MQMSDARYCLSMGDCAQILIDADFGDAYERLHRLGWVHSAEAWHDGRLVGGVYGVAIGGLFVLSTLTRV